MVNALSTLLVGLPVQQWDDAALPAFRRKLQNAFDLIESKAVELSRDPGFGPDLEKWLKEMADARVRHVAEQLAETVGPEEAARRLEAMAARIREDLPAIRAEAVVP